MIRFLSLIIVVLLAFSQNVHGQARLLRFADKQYYLENYRFAANEYVRAFNKKNTHYAAKMAAESFTKIQDFESSFYWWEKTTEFEESTKEEFAVFNQLKK